MPEWLQQSFGTGQGVSPWIVAVRLAVAFIFGVSIAVIYRFVRRNEATPATFPPTLVILAILCAMLPHVIGDHVARAFSLVGALSIVRFRTVVEDTQDIAFVIFAVLVGMAVGAGHWEVAVLGTIVVGFAACLAPFWRTSKQSDWSAGDATLIVRVGIGPNPEARVQSVFEKYLRRFDLISGATGRQGAALDLTYKVRLNDGAVPAELIGELNRVDGIQSVELRRM